MLKIASPPTWPPTRPGAQSAATTTASRRAPPRGAQNWPRTSCPPRRTARQRGMITESKRGAEDSVGVPFASRFRMGRGRSDGKHRFLWVSGVHGCLCCGGDPDETIPAPPRARECVLFLDPVAHAWGQTDSKLEPAPSGFASRRDCVDRGKVETVEYDSKSVGDTRKMMVYLPPGYSKTPNTRSSICCTAPVITKGAGPGTVQPTSFSTISSPTRRSSP